MSESDLKNNGAETDNTGSAKGESKKGAIVELDFAPSWARTSPEDHLKSIQSSRFESDGGSSYNRRSGSRDARPGGGGERFNRQERDNKKFERKPARRREFEQDRAPQPAKERSDAPPVVVEPGAASGAQGGGGFRERREYNPQERGGYNSRPQYEQHPPVPLEVRVLPEQKALGAVIRRIQSSHHAFPLRDIAWLFLDKPASCLVRLAQLKDEPAPLFQCKVCGMPALSEEEMELHLMNRHLNDFFDVEEVECGPPGGQFVCVMRCGMTGELLGPPNHHSYNTKVHDMLRTKFPNMSEEAYRRKIESVRESEVIEAWRQSCTKKSIYRRKSVITVPMVSTEAFESESLLATDEQLPAVDGEAAPIVVDPVDNEIKAPPMEREVAELVFKREVLPKQYIAVKHMICIASTALQTPNKGLYYAIKDMLNKERRFPTSLFFALRGAFRHRKLHLFRANEAKGPDFVMQKKPSELDPIHTVELVKKILAFLHDHPACTKMELVQALSLNEEGKIKEILGQLAWLIDKGNIIEFYNDVLSPPIEFPSFRLREGEKKQGKRGESIAAEEPKSEDKSEKKKKPLHKPASKTGADVKIEAPAPEPEMSAESQVETPAPEPEVIAEAKAETPAPAPEVSAEAEAETPAPAPKKSAKAKAATLAPKPEVSAEVEAETPAPEPKKSAKAKAATPAPKPEVSAEIADSSDESAKA